MTSKLKESDVAVLHAADLHLGGFRFAYNYLERTQKCCDAFVERILGLKVKVIILVICGDLWDTKALKEDERAIGTRMLLRLLQDKRVHIVLTNGNHDYYDHKGLTMIHQFQSLQEFGIADKLHVVSNDPGMVTVDVQNLKYVFLCVPCQQNLTTKELRGLIKTMRKLAPKKRTRCYTVIHEAIANSTNENGYKFEAKVTIPGIEDIDGHMLGDIHRRQQMSENAWYCGSPWQTHYDEEFEKGILRWIGSSVELLTIEVPRLIETKSVKVAKRYANTEHSVRYVGLEAVDFDAPNIQVAPKAEGEKDDAPLDFSELDTEDINKLTSITSRGLVHGLDNFLAVNAKLPVSDVKYGMDYVHRELQLEQ